MVHCADVVLGSAALRQTHELAINTLRFWLSRAHSTIVANKVVAVLVCQEQSLKHLDSLAVQWCWVAQLENDKLRSKKQKHTLPCTSSKLQAHTHTHLDRLAHECKHALGEIRVAA